MRQASKRAFPDSAERQSGTSVEIPVGTIRPKRSASCWKAFAVISIACRIVMKRTWASEVRNVDWAFLRPNRSLLDR